MPRPEILQLGAYAPWDQEPLEAAYTVHRHHEAADKAAHLAEAGPRVRAIATRGDLGASAAVIAACPRLELIAVNGVGYDAVDLAACKARGIAVTNTPDVLTDDVADLAIGMMLAQARGIVGAEAFVRGGHWPGASYPLQRRASSLRAGVLGLGRIGQAIARRAQGFGMPVAYTARSPKAEAAPGWRYFADPLELAEWAEVLFLATNATPETRHIVNAPLLEALGPRGMLVNISRGGNVDEEALIAALQSGRLGSAALDVFEGEPEIDPRFLTLPNVLLQPHQGSATVETRRAMGQLVRDNLAAHFAGRPLLTPLAF